MKKTVVILSVLLGSICLAFIAMAPDLLSLAVTVVMGAFILFGAVFGIAPSIMYIKGFKTGLKSIQKAKEINSDSIWTSVANTKPFFYQRDLDELFDSYIENAEKQKETGIVISDIEDYINEDSVSIRSWRGVVLQIAGTLTSLGLLGTFLGLITGVNAVTFSTVEATMTSIEVLLKGIATAFYTSIIGVILSILFNVIYRLIWNSMLRQMQVFIEEYHLKIQPSPDELLRVEQLQNAKKTIETLSIIKDNSSIMLNGADNSGIRGQRLMIDILSAAEKGEIGFVFEPILELAEKKTVKAICALRWMHSDLGEIHPSVYMPVIESNGYITKLNRKLWDNACSCISEWKANGNQTIPVVLSVSKTDLMALDIADCMSALAEKYSLEPRAIEIAIAFDCYITCEKEAKKTEEQLLKKGFKVIIKGFDGSLDQLKNISADEIIINVDNLSDAEYIKTVIDYTRKKNTGCIAENISSAKQVAELIKAGCKYGCGKYLANGASKEEFEKLIQYN
ncbi:MAG: EAL domain-containing protein [Clostridia bacterium]|nr:EAL domain-containing protein [Clostridia bacterium]